MLASVNLLLLLVGLVKCLYVINSEEDGWSDEVFDGNRAARYRAARYRRATKTYYVDIVPVVDYSMFERFNRSYTNENSTKEALHDYLTHILTTVDQRLQTLQLTDTVLRAKMVTPYIATRPEDSPFSNDIKMETVNGTKVFAPGLLETFADWANNQSTAILEKHDHAMLFISYELIPVDDPNASFENITLGLANRAALCRAGSVSLVEDQGAYQSEIVAAHELGHSLGSWHDGQQDPACSSTDRWLMSVPGYPQAPDNLLNPWIFSTCSNQEIQEYIATLEGDENTLLECLQAQDGVNVNSTTTMTANYICQAYWGPDAFPCRSYTNFTEEICTGVRCRTPTSETCTLFIPPTGMCCGDQKKCFAGSCIDAETGECPTNELCPLGDQPVLPREDIKSCGEIESYWCYQASIQSLCCATCETYATNITDCEYGDKVDCTVVTEIRHCEAIPDNESICCATCSRLRSPPVEESSTQTPRETTAADITTDTPTSATDVVMTTDGGTTASATENQPTVATTQASADSSTDSNNSNAGNDNSDEDPSPWGYKPDGFVGCYLPPCAAITNFDPRISIVLCLTCWFCRYILCKSLRQ